MNTLNLFAPEAQFRQSLLERLCTLRTAGAQIQSQPLGCMRLALRIGQKNAEAGQFLHVWNPTLPKQPGGPFIHTHVFHLRSRVVHGLLIDTTYEAVDDPNGDYKLILASCKESHCQPHGTEARSSLRQMRRLDVRPGQVYEVEKGLFHSTDAYSRYAHCV